MNKILNELIQLQELHYTLWEQQPLVAKDRLADLESAIAELMNDLPPPISRLYQQLREKHQAVVVPETNGSCSACAISLPTLQTQEIRLGNGIEQCPNCRRILYHAEGASRQLKKDSVVTRTLAGVARFSSEELMLPEIEAEDRDGVLAELVGLMAEKGFVDNPGSLLDAALRREAIVPTALDRGLAFPHVRGVEGGGLTFSLGLKTDGLRFDPASDRLSHLIFFIVSPSAASVFYLKLLSGLIETFREDEAQEKLLGCGDPERMWKVLKSLTRKTVP